MSAYYFSKVLDDYRTLYLAPLTDRRLAESGQDIPDVSGYFLFEKRCFADSGEIDILARAISEEAAFRLRDLLRMT